jgi:hypothetical protein
MKYIVKINPTKYFLHISVNNLPLSFLVKYMYKTMEGKI